MGDQEFISAAKKAIVKAFNERKGSLHPPLKEEELYVVWLAKALQNNKALLSTSRSGDGLYFEVTNNGDKNEMYLDVYKKQENIRVPY
ncbi:DUF6275 family protein [Enterococcus avium]|uniref:DUF6275 family protein n=1 Tax=Enterococcus avium TaxID=33945 RepID=A0AAW8S0A3_ENTAV|nr:MULTISPECIES: DUF6275 family protein [Enterococcus]MDT2403911.1 DUF6275 family protein [Enterococcus avium]MDT2433980.1 DUF6275 family protein [Enterococcus avium]MDT2531825.1 DUF6275 family protein [Enterococcus raffinosus]